MRAPAKFAGHAIAIVLLCCSFAFADGDPLHTLIDAYTAPTGGLAPPPCSDAEFLRRVSLDLVGRPPRAKEARQFIADADPDKRQKLVDRLLASPHYPRHMASTLDLMLMERRANTHVAADVWQAWLVQSVRENKPWNVLVREILTTDGADPATRPAARFALDRGSDPHMLTRDVGRIFFGRDMQCAQCHDHPIVRDYLQSDYQGLLALLSPSYALASTVNGAAATVQAERPGTDINFQSVFVGTPRRTGPRTPDCVMLEEPFYLPGDDYVEGAAGAAGPVPKFSRRTKLAEQATNGSNEAFNRNIANRLWAHMFGRGLVHPVDMHHHDNPASDPELLRLLADQIAAMNYDVRAFLREIALSSTYQRSFDIPVGIVSMSTQANAEIAKFQALQEALKTECSTSEEAYTTAATAWEEAEAAILPVAAEFDAARQKATEAKTNHDAALQAIADATAALNAKQALAAPVKSAAEAAQAAARTVPEDTALAEAAKQITAKADALAAEIATLTNAVEEKMAASKPTAEALAAARSAAEAANAKVAPLVAAMRKAEEPMLQARHQAASKQESLAAIDRRIETARQIAKLPDVNNLVIVASKEADARHAEFAAAEKLVAEIAPVVAEHEKQTKTASDASAAAIAVRDAARAELDKHTQAVDALLAASNSAVAAWQKTSQDPVVADAAEKLKQRAEVARTQSDESQKKLEAAEAACKTADAALIAIQEKLAAALADSARRQQALEIAKKNWETAQANAAAKQTEFDKFVAQLTELWTTEFALASLKPLTPEQLCWSVFEVTGVYDRHWQTSVAELDKARPLTEEQKQDPAVLAAREVELEQITFDKLKTNLGTFVSFYGAAAGQPQSDFFSTADQALFAANGGAINSWVAPATGNVTEKIIKEQDPKVAAEELYLTVLTRLPDETETAEVATHLANQQDNKTAAAQELVWALLNSAEFRFNH